MKTVLVLSALLVCSSALVRPKQERKFPDDFLLGAATASYQIEGAWDADDKGKSNWDHFTHANPSLIDDSSNGDVAADSYHHYNRDVEMMRELGINVYRFSISWPRVLPTGFTNKVSEDGIAFYNNYINEMLKYNIIPMITIFHWDLPQSLQDLGGLANPEFQNWFADYSRVLYENFGDRVKLWITFNEPHSICYQAYGGVRKVPVINVTGIGDYLCSKYLNLAHAKAYRIYEKEFKETQGGEVGITINISDTQPLTDSEEDKEATNIAQQFEWRQYSEPFFSKDGGWPKEFEERVKEKSKKQGFPRSRLPAFTEEEIELMKGATDFFGINHYSGSLKSANQYKDVFPVPSQDDDVDAGTFYPEEWPGAASTWLKLVPNSLYNVLTNVRNLYDNPVVYVTENGWSNRPNADLNDVERITYYREQLNDILNAIDDGINVKGYTAWSLMDNFEWMRGYTECFGLYQVDMNDPNRTRTPRKSAYVYKEIVRTRTIDYSYDPDISQPITIDEGH